MIKAVIFDIDETLVNHYKAIENALNYFHEVKSLSDRVTKKDLLKFWNAAEIKFFELYLQGKMTILEQRVARIQYVYKQFGETLKDKEAHSTIMEYLGYYREKWELFDDVTDCLKALQGNYKLGIISNGDSTQQRMKLHKTGIENYFSMTLISGDIGIPKPYKEIFEMALKRLEVKPEETIYVGDDLIKDIEGSSNAGIKPILIDRYNKHSSKSRSPLRVEKNLFNFIP